MGWWSEDIMGGDTPLDIESYWNDEEEKDVRSFYNHILSKWGVDEDDPWTELSFLSTPIAFCAMRDGIPIDDAFKQMVYEHIKKEDLTTWSDPESRDRALTDFKNLLIEYKEGSDIEMPHQKGLLEEILTTIAENKKGLINKK
jgi:hypothetical protein